MCDDLEKWILSRSRANGGTGSLEAWQVDLETLSLRLVSNDSAECYSLGRDLCRDHGAQWRKMECDVDRGS